jgi:hypothetical protein
LARDQVDVRVHNRLPGHLSTVHSNIEADDRRICGSHIPAKFIEQLKGVGLFRLGHGEEIRCVPTGNNQYVSDRHGVEIFDSEYGLAKDNRPVTRSASQKGHPVPPFTRGISATTVFDFPHNFSAYCGKKVLSA